MRPPPLEFPPHSGGPLRFASGSLILACGLFVLSAVFASAQSSGAPLPPQPHAKQTHLKHVLVVSQTKGFEHDSISTAMAAIFDMGKESSLWDTEMRTDTELLTKKKLDKNAKNLDYF